MPGHFQGFAAGALDFFDALQANNDRDWFLEHKAEYERGLKGPMMDLVADLSSALAARDVPLFGDPKRALFRVNRDVRFAKDKSPYKTNISAVLSRDGEKRSQGLLYLQSGPHESFAAAGFYGLEPSDLTLFRNRIVSQPQAWRTVVAKLAEQGQELGRQESAARLPRGYDAAEVGDLADVLKLKGFIISSPIRPAELLEPSLVNRLADFAQASTPLLEFGWKALAERRGP